MIQYIYFLISLSPLLTKVFKKFDKDALFAASLPIRATRFVVLVCRNLTVWLAGLKNQYLNVNTKILVSRT